MAQTSPKPFPIQDPTVTHVVIELFGGDNNLWPYVVEDLQEMAAGNRGNFATLALTDVSDGGGQVVEVSPRAGHRVIEDLGEIDTGDPKTLSDFIARALVTYPSARKALGFWDHGTGVFDENDPNEVSLGRALRGVSRSSRSRSIPARKLFIPQAQLAAQPRLRAMLHDDTSGGVLTNYEAHGVIKDAFKRAGVQKVDVIFSDTCLNGMIEVLEQFREFADVVVASEDLEPGDGWEYNELFGRMSDSPPASSDAWATQMVDAFKAGYQNRPNQHPCTLAAFHTTNDITKELGNLIKALGPQARPGFTSLQEARAFAQSFDRRDTYDIKDFARELAGTATAEDVKKACAAIQQAVDASCIRNTALGSMVQKASGLAFWLPSDRRAYGLVTETYAKLEFDKLTGWTKYLAAFYG